MIANKPRKATTGPIVIYALSDPRSGEVRYIGKAVDATRRHKGHLLETRRKTPLYLWISKLRREGQSPVMSVLCTVITEGWQEVERQIIRQWRDDGQRLLNVADGGDEPHCPKEVRAENGRKNAASRTDTPLKARVYQMKKSAGSILKDRHVSEATKERLRAAMRYAAQKRPQLFGAWAAI